MTKDRVASPLEASVSELRGVGPARARALEAIGLHTLHDLCLLLPRRLESWGGATSIAEARTKIGENVRVSGRVSSVRRTGFGGRRTLVRVKLEDDTGLIDALFFNQPWRMNQLVRGQKLELSGRVIDSKGPALSSPRIGSVDKPLPEEGRIEPEYPSSEGLAGSFLRDLCLQALERCNGELSETLAPEWLERLDLPPLPEAVRALHEPKSLEEFARGRRRLAFEKAIELQARIQRRRRERSEGQAPALAADASLEEELRARLPFELTGDQNKALVEVRDDLARTIPMRRLLQGDVGTGKTMVGLFACATAAAAGAQSAFLAPTELLAEQHLAGLQPLLERLGLESAFLVGSLKAKQRREVLERIASGRAQVIFGTHSLFSADVQYAKLALCVIDEQHRFGVAQRARLLDKGPLAEAMGRGDVHTLLMTATPIPRTLALTVYGDLETSIIRERPPGRGSVRTRWLRGHDLRRLPRFLEERLEAGERVYWVCPRIDSNEEEEGKPKGGTMASAEDRFAKLIASSVAKHGVALVHGRLPSEERAARLDAFRRGEIRVLVATTVIEVGVDVPEATVMVIESAERLGLAQLHQLRGRVGRGAGDSWCLLRGKKSAEERFRALERTNDGFELAEEDLKRRGMGDLAGLRQAGENTEGLGELADDPALLLGARDWVAAHPKLAEAIATTRPSGQLSTP
ncbi:MAG: ATP-dependent DNA helicase RecG [Planctomycetota bacterium]